MSEDLTKKLPQSDTHAILTAIQNLETRVGGVDLRIQGLEIRVGGIDSRIQGLETRVGSVDSRFQGLEQKVEHLEQTVGHLEQTVEQRLHDTRPIWHRLVADIGELQAGQQRLEKGQEAMRAELSELNTVVRNVNRDQIVINDVIRKIQLDFHLIDERLHRFEVNRNPQNSST